MARKIKHGLDYFPFDVTFFQDIKIRKLIKYQGGKSLSVYTCLLCNIYKNGYYIQWDDELPFIISEITGYDEAYIVEVIKSCLNIDLLHRETYRSSGVLTSVGIQNRYEFICKQAKRKSEIKQYNLINSEETTINSGEIINDYELTPNNSEKSTQRKGKEIKGKEIKVEEKKFSSSSAQQLLLSKFISIDQWQVMFKVPKERIHECIKEFSEFKERHSENTWKNESDLSKNFEFWLRSNAIPKLVKQQNQKTNGNLREPKRR